MKKAFFLLASVCLTLVLSAQTVDGWNEFAKTKFEPKYYESLGEYLFYPNFPPELKKLEGKEITLQGYYMPFEIEGGKYIILSKFPYANCFFCGGAGPESIAEVYFKEKQGKFILDQFLTVKGKLKLNAEDVEHVNFILEDAVIVSK
ncbi:MAG TPA: hypothetical protein PKC24_04490 [Cyclobacteriaceae bacterium]|nr:hypothetical protein [Cyclobacteriaceae bacterium]